MKSINKLIFALVIVFITSCNKNDDFDKLDTLLYHEWKLVSVKKDGIEISRTCDLDNILKFENSSDFRYSTGTNICDDEEGLELNGVKWRLKDNLSTLKLYFNFKDDGVSGEKIEYWELIELSDTLMILKDALAEDNNQTPEFREYRN